MDNLGNIFDKETVENVYSFIDSKMPLLNDINAFKEKDKLFAETLENFEDSLSDEQNEKFDNIMKLNFDVKSYSYVLAYFLGIKNSTEDFFGGEF